MPKAAAWKQVLSIVPVLLAILAGTGGAQVPRMLDYQGRVSVRGVNFDGAGQFKFALVDGAGLVSHWSHDGTSMGGSAPDSFVTVPVIRGLYAVHLGDPTVLNMATLTPGVLDHPDVRLRVWFNDGTTGFQLLTPDRRIAAVAYALLADEVPDGSITTVKLAPGSVTADKLAPGVGGASGGMLVVSADPQDQALLNQGFQAIHTYPGGGWENPGASGVAPSGRRRHTAVWTGSSLIVQGGEVSGQLSGQGGQYSRQTNVWSPVPPLPFPIADHTVVWTGGRMIVWGGITGSGLSNAGNIYDPGSLTELPTATAGAPAARGGHSAVWTGTHMIVWGGANASGTLDSGGIYTPSATGGPGAWVPLPGAGAPPSGRRDHTALWVGGRMLVWGGEAADGTALNNGAAYDPVSATWTALPASPLSGRFGHSAAVLEGSVLIWGGSTNRLGGSLLGNGALYDSATGSWTLLPDNGAPGARYFHQAVSTGSEVLIVGGELANGQPVQTGAAFHAGRQSWRTLPSLAEASTKQTATWTGDKLAVFGASGLRLLDPKPAATLYGKF